MYRKLQVEIGFSNLSGLFNMASLLAQPLCHCWLITWLKSSQLLSRQYLLHECWVIFLFLATHDVAIQYDITRRYLCTYNCCKLISGAFNFCRMRWVAVKFIWKVFPTGYASDWRVLMLEASQACQSYSLKDAYNVLCDHIIIDPKPDSDWNNEILPKCLETLASWHLEMETILAMVRVWNGQALTTILI